MTPLLESVTMPVGTTAVPTQVTAGVKPYFVMSSAPNVHAQLLDDGRIRIIAAGPGSGQISVQDSSVMQTTLSFAIDAAADPLVASIGSSLTLAPGASQSFTVSGGIPPYTASSSNPSVASVSGGANGTYSIQTGSVLGSATITVLDSAGSEPIVLNVTNAAAQQLAVSPETIDGQVGDTTSVVIIGGVPPYTVTSSNRGVATTTLSNNVVSIGLAGAGISTVTILDRSGANVAVEVTAVAPQPPAPTPDPTPTFVAIPPAQTLCAAGPVTFTLANGTGPYYASIQSNAASILKPSLDVVPAGASTFAFERTGAAVVADVNTSITINDVGSAKTAVVRILVPQDGKPCP